MKLRLKIINSDITTIDHVKLFTLARENVFLSKSGEQLSLLNFDIFIIKHLKVFSFFCIFCINVLIYYWNR